MIGVAQKFALFRSEIVLVEYRVWRVRETPAQFRLQRRIDKQLEDIGLRHLLDGDVRALVLIAATGARCGRRAGCAGP